MQCVPIPDVPFPTFATLWTVLSFWKHLALCSSALINLFLVCPKDVFDSGVRKWWMTAQYLVEGGSKDHKIYSKHSKLTILRKLPQFSDLKCKNLCLVGFLAHREITVHGVQQWGIRINYITVLKTEMHMHIIKYRIQFLLWEACCHSLWFSL